MARLVRICLKCDYRVADSNEAYGACANMIDDEPCGSKEWALVPLPDAELRFTVADQRFLRSTHIDPEV